jgi:predicted RNase H-like nuclease (RuvC/YqgF family)
MSGVVHVLGNVGFGPAQTLWEEQPTLRELYDQACAGLVRAECEIEELRAEVALLKQGMVMLARERDQARNGETIEEWDHWRTTGERDELAEALREARATIESLRDQLCADKCRDKAAADGGWSNI